MQPIQRAEPLVNQVYRYLKDAILTGRLAPGEKIVETKLAADLSVSRSPVREAIRLLTTEQLLDDTDGTISVFQPSEADFYELYELRLAVEPAAAKKAAENGSADKLQALEKNIEETRACLESGQLDQLIYLNSDFHQTIWEMAGNLRFQKLLDNVSALIHFYCFLILNINRKQTNILQEHTDIYLAIKEGQGDRAYEAMFGHIMRDLEVIQRQAVSPSA